MAKTRFNMDNETIKKTFKTLALNSVEKPKRRLRKPLNKDQAALLQEHVDARPYESKNVIDDKKKMKERMMGAIKKRKMRIRKGKVSNGKAVMRPLTALLRELVNTDEASLYRAVLEEQMRVLKANGEEKAADFLMKRKPRFQKNRSTDDTATVINRMKERIKTQLKKFRQADQGQTAESEDEIEDEEVKEVIVDGALPAGEVGAKRIASEEPVEEEEEEEAMETDDHGADQLGQSAEAAAVDQEVTVQERTHKKDEFEKEEQEVEGAMDVEVLPAADQQGGELGEEMETNDHEAGEHGIIAADIRDLPVQEKNHKKDEFEDKEEELEENLVVEVLPVGDHDGEEVPAEEREEEEKMETDDQESDELVEAVQKLIIQAQTQKKRRKPKKITSKKTSIIQTMAVVKPHLPHDSKIPLSASNMVEEMSRNTEVLQLFASVTTNLRHKFTADSGLTEEDIRRGVSAKPEKGIHIQRDFSNGAEEKEIGVFSTLVKDKEEGLDVKVTQEPYKYQVTNSFGKCSEGKENKQDRVISCECTDFCGPECPCVTASVKHGHSLLLGEKVLRPLFNMTSTLLFACGDNCKCKSCGNRLPKSAAVGLEVVQHNKEMGFGVRSKQDILEGEIVMEFVGDVACWETSKDEIVHSVDGQWSYNTFFPKVESKNPDKINKAMEASLGGAQQKWPLGAAIEVKDCGNVGRLINGAHYPNVAVVRAVEGVLNPERIRLFIIATRPILAGQELFLDYGKKYDYHGKCQCGTVLCGEFKQFLQKYTMKKSFELLRNIQDEQRNEILKNRSQHLLDLAPHAKKIEFAYGEFAKFCEEDNIQKKSLAVFPRSLHLPGPLLADLLLRPL